MGNGSALSISGNISDTSGFGMVYNGPGQMTLSGSNSYTSLNITGGTVTMSSPSSLAGAVTNSGTLQLSNQTGGIASFASTSYTQAAGGTLSLDYNSPTNFSQLAVSGMAHLNGALSINARPQRRGLESLS